MIEDQSGRVIYRRPVMYIKSSGISLDREVDRLEPHTVIFTRKIRDKHLAETEGQVIPADRITDFPFKDLEMLIRIGGLTDLAKPEIIGMDDPWRYRNKAQFPFGTDKGGNPVTGFYAARSMMIIIFLVFGNMMLCMIIGKK